MGNGYKILWTDLALEQLAQIVKYLEEEFTDREIKKLAEEIERILSIISQNPLIYPISDKAKIRKAVVLKFNTLYYRPKNQTIEILSFFSNRQNPESRKINP